jgi:hypothetical protein
MLEQILPIVYAIVVGASALGGCSTFYRWVWVPRQERIKEERERAFGGHKVAISLLMKWVENPDVTDVHNFRDLFQVCQDRLKMYKDDWPQKMLDLTSEFSSRAERLFFLIDAHKASLDLMVSDKCIGLAQQHSGGWDMMTYALSRAITPALMRQENIKRSWFTDYQPDLEKRMIELTGKPEVIMSLVNHISDYVNIYPKPERLNYIKMEQAELRRLGQKLEKEIDKKVTPRKLFRKFIRHTSPPCFVWDKPKKSKIFG